MIATNITIFLASCIVMVVSGSYIVRSLSKIASYLRLSEYVVGFILMAFSTSLPELFVGIRSAMAGTPELSLGTVIGSNIADLTIITGVVVLLAKEIKIESHKIKTDALYMFFIAAMPLALMLIGKSLSRIDGIILIAVFFLYSYKLIKERKGFKKEVSNHTGRWGFFWNFIIFTAALGVLFFSAKYVVVYATSISLEMFIPPIFIGLFLIALGTSLPELIFDLNAIVKKHPDMVLGNTIGSVVLNSTLVLGITALICPITANFTFFFSSSIFMVVICFLFSTFVESGNKLYWKEGVAMVLLYSLYMIIEFYIKTLGG